MKRKIDFMVLMVFVWLSMVNSPAQSLAEEYESSYDQSVIFSSQIEELFMNNEVESLLERIPLSDREMAIYGKWLTQHLEAENGYCIDSISFMLPVLGFDGEGSLIHNATLTLWQSDADSSFSEFIRFRDFILRSCGDAIEGFPFKPEKASRTPGVNVEESNMDLTIDHAGRTIDVKADFMLSSDTEVFPGEISLFFNYPVKLRSLRSGSIELEGRHIYTSFAGKPVHQVIVECPSDRNNHTFKLSVDYGLDFENHALSRKQVGFSGENGYIVLEAGWYPWFEQAYNTMTAQINVTLADHLKVICPGKVESVEQLPGELLRYSFVYEEETWPFIVWGQYLMRTDTINQSEIQYHILKNGEADIEKLSSVYRKIYCTMEEYLPDPQFDYQRVVEVGRKGGYGPRSNLLIDSDYIIVENVGSYETVELLGHELTHSWVNSLNKPSGPLSQFISEGLATFFGAEITGKICGEFDKYLLWSRNYREYTSLKDRSPAPIDVNDSLMHANNRLYRGIVYYKSAYFFRLLEKFSGKESFRKILKEILLSENNEFTMEYLRAVSERVNGLDYPYLFNQFLETNEMPDDNDILCYADRFITEKEKTGLKNISDSVFYFLDHNDEKNVLKYFSDDSNYTNKRVRREVAAVARSWKYKDTSLENGEFYCDEENLIRYVCPLVLFSGNEKRVLSATMFFVKSGNWKLYKISFG